jgi:hypothetical protein
MPVRQKLASSDAQNDSTSSGCHGFLDNTAAV